MSKLWKILAGIVAVVLVLLLALAVAVALIFEPNDYRPYIVNAVEQSTGRQLQLEGDLDLSVFPCCAVAVGPATLSNPAGFPDEPFAKLDGAALSLKIWPLIAHREIQIGKVSLGGLHLSLIELADGRNNWTFEGPSTDTSATPEPPDEDGFSLDTLSIAGLDITDSEIGYRNLGTDAAYTASELRIRTGAIGPDLSFPVEFSANLADKKGGAELRVAASAALSLGEDQVQISEAAVDLAGVGTLKPADVKLELRGSGRAGASVMALSGTFNLPRMSPSALLETLGVDYRAAGPGALASLSASGDWQLGDDSAVISNLDVRLDDTGVTGQVAIEDFANANLSFKLTGDAIDIDRYLSQSAEAAPESAATEPTSVPLEALRDQSIQGELVLKRLQVSGLSINDLKLDLTNRNNQVALALTGSAGDGSMHLKGSGDLGRAEPQISGSIELASLSPRAMLESLGQAPDTADPAALSLLSGKAEWLLSRQSLALQQIQLKLDQTQATGNIRVRNFDQPDVKVDLGLDRLDLDAYMPAESESATAGNSDAEIPVDTIRNLNITGTLRAEQLKLMNLRLQHVRAQLKAMDGVLRLDPLQADLYGGQYTGAITIDATGPKAALDIDQQLNAVQIGSLLQDYVDTDRISGALTMQLAGNGRGNSLGDLLQGLDGAFSARLEDGVYHGMDIQYEIRRARALLKKQAAPAAPAEKDTPIRQLSLSGRVADGVLGSDDLSALLPGLRLSGKGGVNLLSQALDYQLVAEVLKEGQPSGSDNLGDLVDIAIPLSIAGPLTSPAVSVDMKGLLTRTVRDTVEKRARDLLLEKLGGSSKPAESPAETPAKSEAAEAPAPDESPGEPDATKSSEPASAKDLLKRGLRDLLKAPEDKN